MKRQSTRFFKAGGIGNAIFTSVEAFADNHDFARREHAAILAFRRDLAGGMPLEDAESFLRLDLAELGVDNEDWIKGIVDNPDRDPPTVYSTASDFEED